MSRTFGIECELHGGTAAALDALGIGNLHDYHCDCDRCTPHRHSPDWTAQEDCTADGELISRVLEYGSGAATTAIENLASALRTARVATSDGQGVHVHVGNSDMTGPDWVRFWRLWFRYERDIRDMAAGRFGVVRDYNTPVRPREIIGEPGGGLWRRFWEGDADEIAPTLGTPYSRAAYVNTHTRGDTVEFRLWNATRVGWRLHLAVGVSVALIECAVNNPDSPSRHDERPLVHWLNPYLTDESYAAVLRHAHYRLEQAA